MLDALDTLCEEHRTSLDLAMHVAYAVTDALAYAHRTRIHLAPSPREKSPRTAFYFRAFIAAASSRCPKCSAISMAVEPFGISPLSLRVFAFGPVP